MGEPSDDDLLEPVRATGLLVPGAPVVVMLSGGRDSVCLLDVAIRLSGADVVSALHVDYRLRGADAARDARHCARLCDRLGVALDVQRPARPAGAGNLQAWARDARYAAAARLALRRGAAMAAGHTASDQAETVLYRLAASPGRRALLGMRPRDGRLVRPLLGLTREQTAAHCRARGLAWREDASNASDSYARGRVRHELLPALRAIHPAAQANVLRTAALLRDEAAVLEDVVADVLDADAGRHRIPLARLAELAPALRRLVVGRLAEDAAGEPVPGARARVDELLALGGRGGSAELHLGGVRAVVEYGVLRFAGPEPAGPPAPVALGVPGRARFGDWELRCAPGPVERCAGALDAGALAPELLVRGWRPGDRMRPLGLGGSRTLQDLFTDRRVPRARRRRLPIVESAGEIAWVPGVATAQRFRITDATTRAVHLSATAPAADTGPP